ncbi:uncharacterized protein LOC144772103 [Lissotriton helveticus]
MDSAMEDFAALLGNLSRACQELEEIKQEQGKDHQRISKSFERALLCILRQEQSIMNQVEQEHGQLRAKLTSLQRVNEQALQDGVSEISSMVEQIAKVSSQLQAMNSTKCNAATIQEIQKKVAEIFDRKKSIIIRLKNVQFSPCQLQTPALGEIHYEEQTFGFSIPYFEGRGPTVFNGSETSTTPLLSDEQPPWDVTSSDSGSTDNSGTSSRKKSLEERDGDIDEPKRKNSRNQPIRKRMSKENTAVTGEKTFVISPTASLASDSETKTPGSRTVNKIRISESDSSSSVPVANGKAAHASGADPMFLRRTSSKDDRTVHNRSQAFHRHVSEEPVLTKASISTGRGVSTHPSGPYTQQRDATIMKEQSHTTKSALLDPNNPSHSTMNAMKDIIAGNAQSNVKKLQTGVSSQNVIGSEFSNCLDGKPPQCLENTNIHLSSSNYSKASKRDQDECDFDTKHYRNGELTAHITKQQSQTNKMQPLPITEEKQDGRTMHGMPVGLTLVPNQDSVFRATTAFVYEDDSDNSDDASDGKILKTSEKDPKACRVVAIRGSRVPSAQKVSSIEQLSSWNSMELISNVELSSPIEEFAYDLTESPFPPDSISFQANLLGQNYRDLLSQKKANLRPQPEQTKSSERSSMQAPDHNSAVAERSPSPTESIKSSYTFILDSPREEVSQNSNFRANGLPISQRKRLPPTPNHRPTGGRPVIASCTEPKKDKSPPQTSRKKQLDRTLSDVANSQHPGAPVVNTKRDHYANFNRLSQNKSLDISSQCTVKKYVGRSTSMPVIDGLPKSKVESSNAFCSQSVSDRRDSVSSSSSSKTYSRPCSRATASRAVKSAISRGKASQYGRTRTPSSENVHRPFQRTKGLSKSESNLISYPLEEDEGPFLNRLIGQFSKYGSGRGELNLPHGIHTTLMGALYIIDYGNRRVQVMDCKGCIMQQITLEAKNYFDIAVNNKGLVALTNSSDRTVEVYSKHGKLLQVISKNLNAPRGITSNFRDEFVIADMKLGTLSALTLDLTTGRTLESTIMPGFNKPYLVGANSQGLLAVSERGFDGGCCVKVLNDDWQVLRVLGLKGGIGPVLSNPWGVCVDNQGDILVADWGSTHSVVHYPIQGSPTAIVTDGLSSPRGIAVLQNHYVLVADSMHNCIKVFQYK